MSFMFFSVVCSLRPPKIEDVGIYDMFCFEAELYVKISERPRVLFKICKHYSVRKREDIKIRTRPSQNYVRIAACLNPKCTKTQPKNIHKMDPESRKSWKIVPPSIPAGAQLTNMQHSTPQGEVRGALNGAPVSILAPFDQFYFTF